MTCTRTEAIAARLVILLLTLAWTATPAGPSSERPASPAPQPVRERALPQFLPTLVATVRTEPGVEAVLIPLPTGRDIGNALVWSHAGTGPRVPGRLVRVPDQGWYAAVSRPPGTTFDMFEVSVTAAAAGDAHRARPGAAASVWVRGGIATLTARPFSWDDFERLQAADPVSMRGALFPTPDNEGIVGRLPNRVGRQVLRMHWSFSVLAERPLWLRIDAAASGCAWFCAVDGDYQGGWKDREEGRVRIPAGLHSVDFFALLGRWQRLAMPRLWPADKGTKALLPPMLVEHVVWRAPDGERVGEFRTPRRFIRESRNGTLERLDVACGRLCDPTEFGPMAARWRAPSAARIAIHADSLPRTVLPGSPVSVDAQAHVSGNLARILAHPLRIVQDTEREGAHEELRLRVTDGHRFVGDAVRIPVLSPAPCDLRRFIGPDPPFLGLHAVLRVPESSSGVRPRPLPPLRRPARVAVLDEFWCVPPVPGAPRLHDLMPKAKAAVLADLRTPQMQALPVRDRKLHGLAGLVESPPDVVVLAVGFDELRAGVSPDLYAHELRYLVHAVQAMGARPVVVTVPPFPELDPQATRLAALYAKQVAHESGALVADAYSASKLSGEWPRVLHARKQSPWAGLGARARKWLATLVDEAIERSASPSDR